MRAVASMSSRTPCAPPRVTIGTGLSTPRPRPRGPPTLACTIDCPRPSGVTGWVVEQALAPISVAETATKSATVSGRVLGQSLIRRDDTLPPPLMRSDATRLNLRDMDVDTTAAAL